MPSVKTRKKEKWCSMMIRAEFIAGCAGAVLLAGGCSSSSSSSPTSGTDSTTGSPSTTGGSVTAGAQETSSGASVSTNDTRGDTGTETGEPLPDPPAGFLNPLDLPDYYECSIWSQDCPADQKCIPVANDGGNAWNDWACRPVVENPDAIGESCTLTQGSGVDGYDTCERDAMCWSVDEDGQGTCHGFCAGEESNPVCLEAESSCLISGDGYLAVCIPTCNPLAQDCAEDEACYPTGYSFTCAPDASGKTGFEGDPCEFINACDAGLYCGQSGGECKAAGCCRPFCDLNQPSCPEGSECFPGFEEGVTPPIGQESIGLCAPSDG